MRVADALDELLECAHDAIDPPVCRSFIHPGPNAPHDVCEIGKNGTDGQLWVASLGTTPGWPDPTGEPTTCATAWAERIEIGIVRCAKGRLQDDGSSPAEEDVTADATQQHVDKLAVRYVIMCCFGIEPKDLVVEGWDPVDPQGGCVGGVWTIRIRDAGCDCASWTPGA